MKNMNSDKKLPVGLNLALGAVDSDHDILKIATGINLRINKKEASKNQSMALLVMVGGALGAIYRFTR